MAGVSVALAAGACGNPPDVPADDVLRVWTGVVYGMPFEEALDCFSEGAETEWTGVDSSLCPQSGEDAARDAAYRALEAILLEGLEACAAEMRDLPEEEFLARAGKLLDMRGRFARNGAYANLVLVDVVNAAVAANIGERLVRQSGISEGLGELLERLGRYSLDLDAFREMACRELGKEWPEDEEWPEDGDADGQKRLAALWHFLMPGVPLGWPGEETRMDAGTLLHIRGVDGLLVRMVSSDLIVHTLLPSLAQYRKAAPDAPPQTTYRELREVLGDEPAPVSLTSSLWGMKRAAGAAAELVSEVESGKIWVRITGSKYKREEWEAARRGGTGGEKERD